MPRRPTWEDADLLLRVNEMASRPDTQRAIDWFHKNQFAAGPRRDVEIPKSAPEYDFLHRFVSLFETLGVLVKQGVLSEELVLDFWNCWDPWAYFRPTIERERRAAGPEFAENFEWLALRQKMGKTARARSRPRRTRS